MTPYSKVFDAFLSRIDDVELLYPYDNESEVEFQDRVTTLLKTFLNIAVSKFISSETSLERDDSQEYFYNDLRDLEVEILSLLMMKEYYRKKMNFLVQLKHSFSDKDWKSHDKSNQLNQYRQLVKEIDAEVRSLINQNALVDNAGNPTGWFNENG